MPSFETIDGEMENKETLVYKAENLKELFPELEVEDPKVLVPLFNTLMKEVTTDLRHNKAKYNISSVKLVAKDDPIQQIGRNSTDSAYNVILGDGERSNISVKINYTDMDITRTIDYSSIAQSCWMAEEITFKANRIGDIERLLSSIISFVSQQKLEELIEISRRNLEEQSKKGIWFRKDIYDFYRQVSEEEIPLYHYSEPD